jgi:hypothetical protein
VISRAQQNINKIPPNKIHRTKDRCPRTQRTKPTKKHRAQQMKNFSTQQKRKKKELQLNMISRLE